MDKSNWTTMKGSELEALGQSTVALAILQAEGKEVTARNLTAAKTRLRKPKQPIEHIKIIEEEIQL